jgi:predicted RNase H-like HicB family nuclease
MMIYRFSLKCYAEKEADCWVAVCLDFNLAAQGDSFEEAKSKLEAMIADYIYDALAGEDKPYAAQLLARRAPLSAWLKYYA